MLDVMIDLETMGRHADCAIVAIGAVEFDTKNLRLGNQFYQNISLESSVAAGLKLDPDTIMWWMKQSDAARSALTRNPERIDVVLTNFVSWLATCGPLNDIRIWGNDPSFDNAMLAYSYHACGMEQPWKYWNTRCFRTLRAMFPSIEMSRSGEHHNALDDAVSQAEHLIKIFGRKRGA